MKKYCESTKCCTYLISNNRKRMVEKKVKEVAPEVKHCPDCGGELLDLRQHRRSSVGREKVERCYF